MAWSIQATWAPLQNCVVTAEVVALACYNNNSGTISVADVITFLLGER